MQVLRDYKGNDYWNFDNMKKYKFDDENAFDKVKIVVIQTNINNKLIDSLPIELLECLKSGLYIKYIKKIAPYKGHGRPTSNKSEEEKAEERKIRQRKYYYSHKLVKIEPSLPVIYVH